MSELIPSLTIQDQHIEKMYYARSFMPKIYLLVNEHFEMDFTEEKGYVRNYRD